MKTLTPVEQAERIAWLARFRAKTLTNPDLPKVHRTRAERGLARALKALDSPQWKPSVLQRALVQMIDSPAGHLAGERISEDVALKRAATAIDALLANDPAVEAYRGRAAPRALVLQCLRTWPRKGGRGQVTRGGSKYDALHALFVALGIKSGGPSAIKQLLMRKPLRIRKL
ncbi:MAG TPA: hypothetical protein VHW01_13295 [Polyangiaceae bacterium]|nr:hypothetical protein [Polyangiaceae bacterium]